MAYDPELANRIRELVAAEPGLTEKAMFGGLAFLVGGNMAVSANSKGGLMVHVDPSDTAALVDEPHVRRMEMRGRQMDGWLHVDSDVVATTAQLKKWVARGIGHARSLPPK